MICKLSHAAIGEISHRLGVAFVVCDICEGAVTTGLSYERRGDSRDRNARKESDASKSEGPKSTARDSGDKYPRLVRLRDQL